MYSELEFGLIEKCRIPKIMLNSEANKSNWGSGGKRGGFDYKPPYGWIGIGLKVLDLYENNDWLACNGNKNEWAVAYAGVNQKILRFILQGGFKPGFQQVYADYDDIYHPGNKVGHGVYCSPNVEIIEKFGLEPIEINGQKYNIGLMLRVKKDKIRCPSNELNFWVLDPHEIRPYRILLKEVK